MRPRDAKTGHPLEPLPQPGYYPGFSTLSQQKYWDEATRQLILKRVNEVPPVRFFKPSEVPILAAALDRVLPQDDRIPERRIPILHYIDERLHLRRFHGYFYEGMPEDDQAHRLGIEALEQTAREVHRRSFVELEWMRQEELLDSIRKGEPRGAHELWKRIPARQYFRLLVQDAAAAYYAHPWAWDEIGFGGPAYPRGYMRLTHGMPEPWEVEERRYDWLEPEGSLSHQYSESGQDSGAGYSGMSGTH